MRRALLLIAGWIAQGHDRLRAAIERLRPLSLELARLQEQVHRLTVQLQLVRGPLGRVVPHHRPHCRRVERLDILWHAQRYKSSVEETARLFVVSVGTFMNWRRDARGESRLLDGRQVPQIELLSTSAECGRLSQA